jgi:hypothetical protein
MTFSTATLILNVQFTLIGGIVLPLLDTIPYLVCDVRGNVACTTAHDFATQLLTKTAAQQNFLD